MTYYLSRPPSGPIARFIAGVVALCVLTGLVFFGVIVLAIIAAVIVVAFSVAWVRAWWLGRKTSDAATVEGRTPARNSVIEAEYTVISRKRD